jgi:hypothetical protein
MADRTIKIAMALDAAIVLARRVVKLDTDPDARSEGRLASEANDSLAAVAQLDFASFSEL